MKTNLFLLFFFVLQQVFSQNPIWIVAPNYLTNGGSPIPLPTGSNSSLTYQGQPAQYASNAFADETGNLKCFIIDGTVYDHEGYIIGQFNQVGSSDAFGRSELAMVPDPGNCNRIYLFSIAKNYASGSSSPDNSFYAVIDFSQFSDILGNTNRLGLVEPAVPILTSSLPQNGNGFISISKKRSDNSHFVFISDARNIRRYTLDANGLHFDTVFEIPSAVLNSFIRGEMELHENTNPNLPFKYTLAVPFFKELFAGNFGSPIEYYHAVYIAKLDVNGNLIPNSDFVLNYQQFSDEKPFIKGLEFDNSGRYLFISHSITTEYPVAIDYVDLITLQEWLPFPSAAVNAYENSQIEFRIVSNQPGLYLANSTSLGRIAVNGNNLSFQSNVINTGIQPSYMGADVNGFLEFENYKSFLLPDQIDGINYQNDFNYSHYDALGYNVFSNAVWQPGQNLNPFNSLDNTLFIKEELRIKEGTTLELRNMILRFAPEARLIIEHGTTGQGGKLILNNSTLSTDNRCGADLWLGVQVWGNQNQGTMANSTQGRLEIIGNSRIENAHFGALASKIVDVTRNSQGLITGYQFDDSRNGGIIQTTNTNFINNRTGVYLRKYLPFQSAANNVSFFRDSKFMWSSLLVRNNLNINAHIELGEVRGIFVHGCTFENTAFQAYENQFNTVYAGGVGILSRASSFYALTSLSNLQGNQFRNMQAGIFAQGNQIQSFISNQSIFENNIIGILAFSTKYAKVTANTFRVRENTYQTGGLGLYFSTKYTVEDNEFSEFENNAIPNGNGNTYGIVVNNSGKDNNEIYRNTFKNLKVGGQSEGNNATSLANNNPLIGINFKMTGLRWTCNTFISDIYKADLTVASGARINFHQGVANGGGVNGTFQQRLFGAARNSFSMVGESTSNIQHDLMAPLTAQSFSYAHLYDLNHTPDAYSSIVSLDGVEWNNNPMYMVQNGCPKRKISFVSTKIVDSKRQLDSLDLILTDLNAKLLLGLNEVLLNRVNTVSNISTVKNELLAASPYLSDEILLSYLNRNPSAGHVKEVLVANSGLSDLVREKLASMSLPNGIRNQINQHQNKLSGRTQTVWERNYQESVREIIFNELIATLLAEIVDEQSFERLISILKENNDLETIKTLREIYLSKGDDEKIAEYKQIIFEDVRVDQKYKEVIEIEKDIRFNESIEKELREHPVKKARLEEISQEATELTPTETVSESKAKAKTLLEIADKIAQINEFEEVMPATSGFSLESTTSEISEDLVLSSVYPNPTRGELFIDFPTQEDGTLFITVYTIGGQLVERFVLENTNGERIDLSHLTKGLYLVDIVIDDVKMGTHKVQIK
jgi:hypothetical protein